MGNLAPDILHNFVYGFDRGRSVWSEQWRLIIGAFTSVDRATLIERLRKAAIAFGEVNDVAGLSNHPSLRRIEVSSPTGPVSMVAPPARNDGETPQFGSVPAVGEHSDRIRKEFE